MPGRLKNYSFSPAVLLGVLLPALFFWSCNPKPEYSSEKLNFRNGTEVPYNSAGQFLEITSEKPWTLTVSYEGSPQEDWATPNSISGNGGVTSLVWIAYSQNNGDTRTADFRVDFSGTPKTIRLRQLSKEGSTGEIPDGFLEIPEFTESGNTQFAIHYIPDRNEMRNYSVLYDGDTHLPIWVAYPMHSSYTTVSGWSGGRTEEWQFDPEITQGLQTNMRNSRLGNDTDGNRFERGHMIPSASRQVTRSSNEQTFYYTNMTPQNSGHNGGIWGNLEIQVRNIMSRYTPNALDTLYVVTGTVLQRKDNPTETVRYTTNGVDSKRIAVPNYYYKALLRRNVVNNTPQYRAVAFWTEHKAEDRSVQWSDAITIRELESRTGINFFPGLSREIQNSVETTINRNEWGF